MQEAGEAQDFSIRSCPVASHRAAQCDRQGLLAKPTHPFGQHRDVFE